MDLLKIFLESGTDDLFCDLLIESSNGKEVVVYKKQSTSQFVSLTDHANNDREHRRWWKSYDDTNFTKFVDTALTILYSMFKRKIEISSKIKRKEDNPHLDNVMFKESEMFGFCNKERTLGLAVSLRPTNERECTSFCIVTILNKNSPDMNQEKDLFLKGFESKNHEKTLDNFKLVTESINGKQIHIIELDI